METIELEGTGEKESGGRESKEGRACMGMRGGFAAWIGGWWGRSGWERES